MYLQAETITTALSPESLIIILSIILGTGLLGGLVGYLSRNKDNPQSQFTFVKYFLRGLIAALCVPLFLHLVSSEIFKNILSNTSTNYYYFIFGGFCLIAAYFSERFLDNLGDKVLAEKIKALEDENEILKSTSNEIQEDLNRSQGQLDNVIEKVVYLNQNDAPLDTIETENIEESTYEFLHKYFKDSNKQDTISNQKSLTTYSNTNIQTAVQEAIDKELIIKVNSKKNGEIYLLTNKGNQILLTKSHSITVKN